MNRYCLLTNSNFELLFESILTERNLYLKYFAYSNSNLLNLIVVLFDKYKQILDQQYLEKKCNESTSFLSYVDLFSNKKSSFSNNKTENVTQETNFNNEYILNINYSLMNDRKFSSREICSILIKLIQNMIIDIGLSDGEFIYDESFKAHENQDNSEVFLNINKFDQLKEYNNILDLYTCLTLNKNVDLDNDSMTNNSKDINISIPKPYEKPREFILKQENYLDDYEYVVDENLNKEIYESKPISYTTNEPYEILKKLFFTIINKFNFEKASLKESFGLNNLIELELLTLIIELFSDLNYTIHVNNLITKHKKLRNGKLLSNEVNLKAKSFKRKSTLNKDKRILQYVKANDDSWDLKHIFTNSEEKVEILINDKSTLSLFYENLIECFFRFENNSILHKNFEYLVQFLFSDYCPKELSDNFIDNSNILNSIVKSNSSFAITKRNLANICEISALLFMTSNSKVQKALSQSKFTV